MKNKTTKSQKSRIFLALLMGIGFILILDGMVSIALQPDQTLLFQAGRIARSTMGFAIILIGYMFYNKKRKR